MCKTVYPDNFFFAACYDYAIERVVKCFSSPFEADHQLVYMNFDFVSTIDTDLILLGANVLRDLNTFPPIVKSSVWLLFTMSAVASNS